MLADANIWILIAIVPHYVADWGLDPVEYVRWRAHRNGDINATSDVER